MYKKEYVSIEEAMRIGKGKVALRGWVYRERGSSKVKFIVLRDSTDIIQCVFERKKFEKQWGEIDKLQIEASVKISGTIKKDKRAPTNFEIDVDEIEIVGTSENFPINKYQSEEFLLDVRNLAIRSRKLSASLKIRSTVMGALHEYIRSLGYTEVEAPSFSGETSEGGSEVFKFNYFGKTAHLTQSWQFYAENLVSAFEKVYAMAPSFRAEKSKTSRHLTEFWHFEVEAAWADMEEIITVAEGCVQNVIKNVLIKNKKELETLKLNKNRLEKIEIPFPRITYRKAIEKLSEEGYNIKYGDDFGAKEEKRLAEYFNNFVIVTNYPLEILKFYHGEDPKNPGLGLNFNILAPSIGEVIDGSQREPDLNKIIERLKKAKINLGKSDWYLDSRRYGSVPHAGFGLGVERLVQWICNLDNIKNAIPFPRTMTRLTP